MLDFKVHTYDEAVEVIREVGLLPLAPLFPNYPSLEGITAKEQWHSNSEFDPWLWRAKFPVDGVAAYGKFVKKKSILISKELLPLVKAVLGSDKSIRERYADGLVSREAMELYSLISEEEGIDTRVLRVKAGLKEKEMKRVYENGILELQGSMDIVIAGTKLKTNEMGEKNGWSSTSYETMEFWANHYQIESTDLSKEEAKAELKSHFANFCGVEAMKALEKIFKF